MKMIFNSCDGVLPYIEAMHTVLVLGEIEFLIQGCRSTAVDRCQNCTIEIDFIRHPDKEGFKIPAGGIPISLYENTNAVKLFKNMDKYSLFPKEE